VVVDAEEGEPFEVVGGAEQRLISLALVDRV
jgi:hypothetical protein